MIIQVDTDISSFASDMSLVPADDSVYRLLMRIRSDTHSRFVDPSNAIVQISWAGRAMPCTHSPSPYPEFRSINDIIKLYSFDELLGRWPGTVDPKEEIDLQTGSPKPVLHMTHYLDSHYKINVA